ncbi:hypothetical protein ES705_21934 [subsurface metagenome]
MRGGPREDIGAQGEAIVREWLKRRGYFVLPASLIDEGGAPMLTGQHIKAILPNNLTWKEGQPGWVEVKTKSDATEHLEPPHRWEHGLPLRQWNAYLKVQEVTKIPVSLAILELKNKLLLIGTLTSLDRGKRIFLMEGKPHVFLNRLDLRKGHKNRSDFEQWYPIDLSLPAPIQPVAPRTQKQSAAPQTVQLPLLSKKQFSIRFLLGAQYYMSKVALRLRREYREDNI